MESPNDYKLTVEQKLSRLALAVAVLATESDRLAEEAQAAGVKIASRISTEEQIERILYVEHFTWTALPEGGVW